MKKILSLGLIMVVLALAGFGAGCNGNSGNSGGNSGGSQSGSNGTGNGSTNGSSGTGGTQANSLLDLPVGKFLRN